MTKTKKAAKAATAVAEPKLGNPQKEAQTELRVRLYAKGEFYFGKQAAERLGKTAFVQIEAKGKSITLTPTKGSSKDAFKVGACHAAPVIRAAKVLRTTPWNGKTQDLVARPVGDAGFRVEVQ